MVGLSWIPEPLAMLRTGEPTMPTSGTIIAFDPAERPDDYGDARTRLVDFLIRYTLIESYGRSKAEGKPYHFIDRGRLRPGGAAPSHEHSHQNTALIFLLDGELPTALNKHFRLRGSNRVTWRNLQRLAPHMDHSDYKAVHCLINNPENEALLAKLCALDYALMIERPESEKVERPEPCQLTHMHVKVERLTDNAIKDLGKRLGYIERHLFERGEDYVDALEAKYYEYFGFSYNASGRKSAAAIAAQLFGEHGLRFTVFVASQEDGRFTLLDDSALITQYLLVRFDAADRQRFLAEAGSGGSVKAYCIAEENGLPVMLYRVRFRRTRAARPVGEELRADYSLDTPWLEIADEAILAPPDVSRREIPFTWSRVEEA